MIPAIKEHKSWNAASVRRACVKNNLYTYGDCNEYAAMLENVEMFAPDATTVYLIAKDIAEHSEDQTISNVMFILANDAVTISYEFEEEQE